jgi:hypothetical protein
MLYVCGRLRENLLDFNWRGCGRYYNLGCIRRRIHGLDHPENSQVTDNKDNQKSN